MKKTVASLRPNLVRYYKFLPKKNFGTKNPRNLPWTKIWIFEVAYCGIVRFSEVLKTASSQPSLKDGCFVDTSILFAASYPPDELDYCFFWRRLEKAQAIAEFLSDDE